MQDDVQPKGFEDYDLRLGDLMRGERATLSKSLLDVQRELRIRAAYIAGIESCDLSAFDAPSFVSGYVRSYARYLNLDPDWAFERFCFESGFVPTHGMAQHGQPHKVSASAGNKPVNGLGSPNPVFLPKTDSLWSRIEPRAIGSLLVLAVLAGGIGYGGWSVLQEVQRVNLTPVDQQPSVVAQLDPLSSVEGGSADPVESAQDTTADDSLDRLFRPATLDTPVLIARDGPIASIDPNKTGVLAGQTQTAAADMATQKPDAQSAINQAIAQAMGQGQAVPAPAAADGSEGVQVTAANAADVEILAVRPSWVRVRAADGSVLLEKVMNAGERYTLPKLAEPPTLRTGESGAIYFAVNGVAHGPVGARGAVTKNITLSADALSQRFAVADPQKDSALTSMFAVADAGQAIADPTPKTE
ncbi:RodZ domain-containing protein [Thioclava sp. GXIMD2076]|uniref:RodZ domain-containing protein n=2 Tax=Paracoccaceae TaxID=31989 RepID=A0ABV1SEG5_9RHOB